ncbi:amidophosphoribosyltransferase PurF [Thermoclostridium stercorarium subsp. stercorarium DSM 8532]|uniref:Amidophosphoribosyltransferase n=2 Tax=Thermoclostridium stercorarium TaxID=1510 RepID=L7VM55_THES1|nr:amidophosphoribosyltransferase PurF [Thermoclostridium stercorarium subsp. stercorarium DSM 8532]
MKTMREIREECGVFGVYGTRKENVALLTYYGLYALQHRGQESCGIAVNNGKEILLHKDVGLVQEVLTEKIMDSLGTGNMAIGHVRYGTTGNSGRANAQPLVVKHLKGTLSTVHNGNIVNAFQLRHALEMDGAIFHTTSDTEVISYVITNERIKKPEIEDAVLSAMDILEGAYSLILMTENKLLAVRDKHGFRPLCYGVTSDGTYVIASESCALDAVGARFIRDIRPGEIVVFEESGVYSIDDNCGKAEEALCIFEYIYFARPDSVIDGYSVHKARLRAGAFLAKDHPVDADIVVGVPDSGIDGAIGYSCASSIPYGTGFIKNKYVGRTFISPAQKMREELLKIKLNPVRDVVSGKRVILVDDSIVRGTTSARIVRLLRDAGAKEVHLRVTSPPFVNPCYYGTDIDSKDNLIACKYSVNEIARIIGVDSLGYLNVEHLPYIADETGTKKYCTACFTGEYKTDIRNVHKYCFE